MYRFLTILLSIFLPFLSVAQDDCQFHRLGKETTPMGRSLEYRKFADSVSYQFFYGIGDQLKSYDRIFPCDHPPVTRPRFVDENEDFIFMSRGCGSACRIGLLLDLNSDSAVREIIYWLEADLRQNLIAMLDQKDGVFVKVLDLNTGEEKRIGSVSCNFGISVDCVRKVEVKNRVVTVHWAEELKEKPVS